MLFSHQSQDRLRLLPWRSVSVPGRHLSLLSYSLYSCNYLNIHRVEIYTRKASTASRWCQSAAGRAEGGCCVATGPPAHSRPGCCPRRRRRSQLRGPELHGAAGPATRRPAEPPEGEEAKGGEDMLNRARDGLLRLQPHKSWVASGSEAARAAAHGPALCVASLGRRRSSTLK